MSSTSEALVQLAEQKEALRQIANRYLDNADKLAVDCTLQDIIDVLNEYDEYSYMNAFLNSIEVFPDKDYSINDTEGHIKGVRNYAFYNNTALKSVNLPSANVEGNTEFEGCTNLESITIGTIEFRVSIKKNFIRSLSALKELGLPSLTTIVTSGNANYCVIVATLPLLNKLYAPNLTVINGTSYTYLFADNTAIKNYNFPNLITFILGSNSRLFYNNTSLETVLMNGTGGSINTPLTITNCPNFAAWIMTGSNVCTLTSSNFRDSIINHSLLTVYVPSSLVLSYASATNWTLINDARPIQDIESHINSLRELGANFSYTPYANKKWENGALVTDSTIGEEVDE